MVQQLTITTDVSVALKPLIESAIRSELRLLELSLERTRLRLQVFERRYDLTSEEFERRFNAGEIAESLDFIEWTGEIETYHRLKSHRQALAGVRLN